MWLIRTTDGHILGPFDKEELRKLIIDKRIVFLDEVSESGKEWALIKNVEAFKDLALKTKYKLDESTVDMEVHEILRQEEPKKSSKPPRFKIDKTKLPIPELSIPVLKGKIVRKYIYVTFGILFLSIIGYFSYLALKSDAVETIEGPKVTETTDYFNRYYIRGREYEEGGLFKEAMENYRRAISAIPNHTGVRIRKAAIDLLVMNNVDEAGKALLELYSEANMGKVPDQDEQCDIKTFLGIMEYKKGNYQASLNYLNQALTSRPTNAYIYYNIGRLMFKQGNYSGAIEYFRNARKLSASISDTALYEGIAQFKNGKLKEAFNMFTEAQKQNHNMRELFTFAAYLAFKNGDKTKAYANIKKLLTIDPFYFKKEFTPLYQIERESFIDEEIAYIKELANSIEDIRQKEDLVCVLAIMSMIKGETYEGIKSLAILNKTESSEKFMTLGVLYFHQDRFEDAKQSIEKALELDYSNNIAHIYAGELALRKNDIGQARNHFTKAQSSDEQTSLYAITLLGDIYMNSGEQNAAIILWKKVLSMDSRYKPVWERLLKFKN